MKNGTIASLLVVALIIGVAFGTVLFPRTLTHTVTLTQTVTTSVFLRNSSAMATNSVSITTVNSGIYVTIQTTLSACSACTLPTATMFTYSFSINYSGGPWILHYWVENYTGTQNAISGNLVGSGNSDIWISFYAAGQYTLCGIATKGPNDIPLTLSLFGKNASTTASNQYVEVCGAMAP